MGVCHCSRKFATCLPQKCLFGNVGELTPNDFLADGAGTMTPSPDLAVLLERVESATGPNYDLECEIERVLAPERLDLKGNGYTLITPCSTSSIDATISLIETRFPGWCWQIKHGFGFEATVWSVTIDYQDAAVPFQRHMTAALALLAALLKAELARERQG